jgi:hypothetical protein
MGVEEEEIQTKGTDNLFNIIIAEKFPNLKKESLTWRKLPAVLTKLSGPKKAHSKTHYNQNT